MVTQPLLVTQSLLEKQSLPRVVIAAPGSGHGKTTVATGLMAALAAAGHIVSGHKVGPDYIDPGYHELATGRPGRNLDPHLVGESMVAPLLLHGAEGCDLAVIEGVMGLFDGQLGSEGFASTAHVAALTRSPIILVVDASHASRSIGAVVHGLATFDPGVQVAGVIVNKVGSDRHAAEVRSSIGLPVLGTLGRHDQVEAPSRHLGLVPVAERDESRAALEKLAAIVSERIDLAAVAEIARTAPPLDVAPWQPDAHVRPVAGEPVVAVAGGRAFTFRYAETAELLTAAGARVEEFDPLTDADLPAGTAGLYLGGGFPEVHATELAANRPLLARVREAVRDGVPTVAECAGLLYLCRTIDGVPMAGAIDADAQMTSQLTLGYRDARPHGTSLYGPAAATVTAHEFHRTTVRPAAGPDAAWQVDGRGAVGWSTPTLHASYLHTHWAGHPQLARAFLDAIAPPPATSHSPLDEQLRHHGDAEARAARWNFAVNVCVEPRPDWLEEALQRGVLHSDGYPDPTAAHTSIARHYGRGRDEVLATAGAAEAFGLIARLRPWRRPVVVHPQFTEPDVALTMAGQRPEHVYCEAPDFGFDPSTVPSDADLVVVGNPTNPTGVVHRAVSIRSLLRPGRLVVVDEAFMDFVPGEPESLISEPATGLVVIRSLTKMWSMPGIRAGYVVGDAEVLRGLRALQTPWAVSTPALEAMAACCTPRAAHTAADRAHRSVLDRDLLVSGLSALGIRSVPSSAPFVLAEVDEGLHDRLADLGIAVRRADTFPGLDGRWVRIAVRPREQSDVLLAALASGATVVPVGTRGRTGRVTLVSAGPGDPSLLTIAARDALRRSDVILTDRLVPRVALDWIAPQAEIIDVAKIPYGPQVAQDRINALLVEHARAGRTVARLKGGDAFVFGRGGEEVEHCTAAGIPISVIPGVSSSIAAAAVAGIPVTHRGLVQGFTVVSGHLPPGHPDSLIDWPALARSGLTLVIVMGVRQLSAIADELIRAGMDHDTGAAVIADATLPTQRSVVATVGTIADDLLTAGLGPPAVTVIGPTVTALDPPFRPQEPT